MTRVRRLCALFAIAYTMLASGSGIAQVPRAGLCDRDIRGNVEIHEAASLGKTDTVRALLESDRSQVNAVNAFGWTTLHCAVGSAQDAVVDLLLRNGANPDLGDSNGATALHLAVGPLPMGSSNDAYRRVIERLLSGQANIQAKDRTGATPLHWAAVKGEVVAVRLLLEAKAEVNAVAATGSWIPLHGAAASGRIEVVQLLLQNKANLDAKDGRGLTPLQVAEQQGKGEVAALLRRHGADR